MYVGGGGKINWVEYNQGGEGQDFPGQDKPGYWSKCASCPSGSQHMHGFMLFLASKVT